MADLNVQPKKKTSILPWLLLIAGILLLLFLFMRGCKKSDKSAGVVGDSVSAATVPAGSWNDIDFNAPSASYAEINDSNVSVRGNDAYGIYGLGENILFDEGKSSLRPDAEPKLKLIASSIEQRYKSGKVRVYGYTDTVGSAGSNKELAEQRAEAVSNWLTANGNVSKDNISLEPVGEARPVATNATNEGRQQNRRVEIVAKKANK